MPLHKNKIIPLEITTIASDANGVGRHEGMVVFVPGTVIGDKLRVRIVKAKKMHAFGRIEQVVTAGGGRIRPDCPISGRCGGCDFRHLTYEAELRAKQGFVQDALNRIGGLDMEVPLPLPSPDTNRYRNKVQYPVQAGADGSIEYGFYAGRSHRVVPCSDCLLQPEELNAIAARCATLLQGAGATAYNEETSSGLVRHIYLRRAKSTGEVMMCFVVNGKHLPDADTICHSLVAEFPAIATIVLNTNREKGNVILGAHNTVLYGDGIIHDELCGVPLRLDAMSFAQVNPKAAEGLFALAKQYAAPGPDDVLLDLYCGAGVIGLSMAKDCKSLIGVEIVPEAIENAKASAQEMELVNTRFICSDAGSAAAQLYSEGLSPDIICVDPPRKGCSAETLDAMLAMAPKRIVMVSCNPATLARDLKILCINGYTLARLQPADMFPRTKHVECVALLEKQA